LDEVRALQPASRFSLDIRGDVLCYAQFEQLHKLRLHEKKPALTANEKQINVYSSLLQTFTNARRIA
jgi:hypothetical protein